MPAPSSRGSDQQHRGWADYLDAHLTSRGWTNTDFANVSGVDRSLIGRWRRGETQPTIDSVRLCCRYLKRDIREGLIAAGFFTPEEMRLAEPEKQDIMLVSDEDLLTEVRRRMRRHHVLTSTELTTDDVVVEERSDIDLGEDSGNGATDPRRNSHHRSS